MAEYCEYLWDPLRGHSSTALARSLYDEQSRINKGDKKLAIKTVRAILRDMPGVDLTLCNDEYITRFLLARKYRTEQAAALIVAYQAQIAHRQDIFGNLTARDPALQRALRAGIPGVLPARDKKGRCVLLILASQWDPIAVPALAVQRAIFLVLEILIQDPRNQQSGFVAVVDWGNFSLRQGGALGAAALRNLVAALRGRFPARFKAIHFLSAPLYVQATLALVKPFLDEKTRSKIYLHGNNLSTLHQHLPTDILPAELGGTGPAFNPGLWAEPVIHSAMKEAELANTKRDKESSNDVNNLRNSQEQSRTQDQKHYEFSDNAKNEMNRTESEEPDSVFENEKNLNYSKAQILNLNGNGSEMKKIKASVLESIHNNSRKNQEMQLLINVEALDKNHRGLSINHKNRKSFEEQEAENSECLSFRSDTNSNEFEMVPSQADSEDNSLEMKVEKIVIRTGKGEPLPEEANLIA
ncbi:clavesin-2-like [Leptopilina heterotoma]|uniref:clavesin-2-like n=1 Tax=Leptopilina heterotoma TaxID=63436 RepID=UPI001CAA2219|nr:clavesin-2-like [Leptopilina heterotoma]